MSKGTKLKYGSYMLYPIWEKFCQHVVDAYGENEQKTLIRAWELTYGLPPTPDKKVRQTRYSRASEWMKKPEINGRCEEIERELQKNCQIARERIVTRNIHILEGDPLITMKEDPETGNYLWKRLNEIPRFWRKHVTPIVVRGRVIYVLDKKLAEERLIELCGFKAPSKSEIEVSGNGGVKYIDFGEFPKELWEMETDKMEHKEESGNL